MGISLVTCNGFVEYDPYPHQEKIIDSISNNQYTAISAVRETGITSCMLVHALYGMEDHKNSLFFLPNTAMINSVINSFVPYFHHNVQARRVRHTKNNSFVNFRNINQEVSDYDIVHYLRDIDTIYIDLVSMASHSRLNQWMDIIRQNFPWIKVVCAQTGTMVSTINNHIFDDPMFNVVYAERSKEDQEKINSLYENDSAMWRDCMVLPYSP